MKIDVLKKYFPYMFGGLLMVIFLNLKKIRLFFEKRKAITSTMNAQSANVQIQGTNTTINLDTLASTIYYAFYNTNGKTRFNEDEKTAINAVLSCPKDYINQLCGIYAQKYGHILKDDLISKMSSKEWQKVENLFK